MCYHVRKLSSEKPSPVSRPGDLCEKCRRQDMDAGGQGDFANDDRPQQASSDEFHRELSSDAGDHISQLKRELLIALVGEKGTFYEAVADLRRRRGITPIEGLPPHDPTHVNVLLPGNAPEVLSDGSYSEELSEYSYRWRQDLDAIIWQEVPERLRYGFLLRVPWEKFVAACVLYDPPLEGLQKFAEYGGPGPQGPVFSEGLSWDEERSIPLMVAPPVRMLQDPFAEMQAESSFWQSAISRVAKRHLEPIGLDLWGMIKEAMDLELLEEHDRRRRENPARVYIDVDEYTTEKDVVNAFRLIRATQPTKVVSGRRTRDRLMCVQCALLHDNFGWTYKRLAELHRWADAARASKYVSDGRAILKES
jgi:hypothetical protein